MDHLQLKTRYYSQLHRHKSSRLHSLWCCGRKLSLVSRNTPVIANSQRLRQMCSTLNTNVCNFLYTPNRELSRLSRLRDPIQPRKAPFFSRGSLTPSRYRQRVGCGHLREKIRKKEEKERVSWVYPERTACCHDSSTALLMCSLIVVYCVKRRWAA